VYYFPNALDTRVMATLVARPLLTPVAQKLCVTNIVYSRAERVFILEHYFAPKLFSSVLGLRIEETASRYGG
jgi:hypothetical protein